MPTEVATEAYQKVYLQATSELHSQPGAQTATVHQQAVRMCALHIYDTIELLRDPSSTKRSFLEERRISMRQRSRPSKPVGDLGPLLKSYIESRPLRGWSEAQSHKSPWTWVNRFMDITWAANASFCMEHPSIPLATFHPPDGRDQHENLLGQNVHGKRIWEVVTVVTRSIDDDGDDDCHSDILSCVVADSLSLECAGHTLSRICAGDTLLQSELSSLLVLLRRQQERYASASQPRVKTNFAVTVIAFTHTHVRVHKAEIDCHADLKEHDHQPTIRVTKCLELAIADLCGRGAAVTDRWVDILPYACFPWVEREPVPKKQKLPKTRAGDQLPPAPRVISTLDTFKQNDVLVICTLSCAFVLLLWSESRRGRTR